MQLKLPRVILSFVQVIFFLDFHHRSATNIALLSRLEGTVDGGFSQFITRGKSIKWRILIALHPLSMLRSASQNLETLVHQSASHSASQVRGWRGFRGALLTRRSLTPHSSIASQFENRRRQDNKEEYTSKEMHVASESPPHYLAADGADLHRLGKRCAPLRK